MTKILEVDLCKLSAEAATVPLLSLILIKFIKIC